MRLYRFLLLGTLLSGTAMADVYQYVEEGSGKIYLGPKCMADYEHWCNCAVADDKVTPNFDDSLMCWKIDGEKIIFSNRKFNIEKHIDDLKIKVEDRLPSEPPLVVESDLAPA
jgi:hypothetical protein